MKTTYNGVTTETSDNLLEPSVITVNNPRKSYKFGDLSLYYDGKYYFPDCIRKLETPRNIEKPYSISVVFKSGKWLEDTFFITEDFKNFLLKFI